MRAWIFLALSSVGLVASCGGAKQAAGPSASTTAPAEPKVAPQGGTTGVTDDVKTSDVDRDGRPEVTKYYATMDDPQRPGEKKRVLSRQDLDLNWDGRVDIWRYFTGAGVVEKEEWDTDYDGRVDEVRTFEDGAIAKSERDENNDGKPDIVRFYKKGKLEKKETDSNGDGQVDRWEYFDGRTLDRIGVDKDHDGTVDSWAKAEQKTGSGS